MAPHGWTRRTKSTASHRTLAFVTEMSERGVIRPSQLTDEVLDGWRKRRMKKTSAATINRGEDVARKMLRWAHEQKPPLCGETPLAARKRLKESTRTEPDLIPSPDEVARIVAALTDGIPRERSGKRERHPGPFTHRALALAIATATATGLRLDEMRHLTEENLGRGSVSVRPEEGPADEAWTSKGHRERSIPVGAEVVELVREFIRERDATGWEMSDHGVGRPLERACEHIELEPVATFHDFRRVFVTEAVRAGIPLPTIQQWVAHRDVRTTQRYIGRYRSDANLVAPTPAAAAILRALPANVVPIRRTAQSLRKDGGGGEGKRGENAKGRAKR